MIKKTLLKKLVLINLKANRKKNLLPKMMIEKNNQIIIVNFKIK